MILHSRKLESFLITFGLFSFVLVSFAGTSVFIMEMNDDGSMGGCIFTGKMMLCQMSIMEHISFWQNMFIVIPQESLMIHGFIIFLAIVLLTAQNFSGPPSPSRNEIQTQKLYLVQHPDFTFFNSLKEAFSQGILNPKIYESAIL